MGVERMKENEEVIRNREIKHGYRENEGRRGSNKKQGD